MRLSSLFRSRLRLLAVLGGCMLTALVLSASAQAATFSVTSTADVVDTNPGDGVCHTDALSAAAGGCTLRAAVQEANASSGADTINVPAGTYTMTLSGSDSSTTPNDAVGDFDLSGDVTIHGAAQGSTIVQAGTQPGSTDAPNVDRLFDVANAATATVTDLTVRNGWIFVFGSTDVSSGGGAIRNLGNLTLQHVTVSRSRANLGGGIYSAAGSVLTVEDSTISDNTNNTSCCGSGSAAGIYSQASPAAIRRTTISGNTSSEGAGILNDTGGSMVIVDSTFSKNFASYSYGGGLENVGDVRISGSTFDQNTSTRVNSNYGGGGGGGAANKGGGTMTVSQSKFTGNTADGGGGVISDGATLTIDESTLSGNHSGYGGGVYVVNGTGNLTNDTISGNDATNAAGAGFCGCDVAVHGLVRNDTIVGNVATQHGGGLAADGGSQGSTLAVESTTIDGNSANGGGGAFLATGWLPTVVNTIIGKNGTATDDRFYNCYYGSYYGGGVTSLGHNIDYTSTCGLVAANGDNKHDQTNTDPKLGPLQDNGGLTRTEAPSTSSPAVDAGDGSANVCPERDQRGTKRPLDGDNDGTVACDIGAVEIGPPTAAITPASLQFGDVRVGDTSPAQNVTVKNTGGSDLTISQINLAANDFHMDQTGDHCIGGTVLHVGQQCTLPVTLAPTSTGDKSGTISFSHDGGTTAPVTLTGKGTPGPTPAVTTDPVTELDFPSTTVGHTDTESVTVKNTGEAPLHISGWDVSNLGGDSAFKAGSGGTCTAGGDVAVGKSCTVKVDFTPGGVKTFNGALDINDNAPGSPHHVSLKGDGTPAAAPSVSTDPSNVDFGSVYTSTSPRPSRSVTVHNGGTATLSVSKIDVLNDGGDSAFYKSGGTCSEGGTVAVGSDCTVQVSFAPTDAKDYTATLVLTDNAQGGAQYVDLGGTGKKDTTPPTIAWGSPTDGKRVEQGEKLQVSFDCGDSETGVAVCQVSHEYDPVSYGQQLPTTTLGKHNLNAIVRDGAGNITNAHIVYYVDPVPPAEAKNAAGSNAANTPSSTSGATLQKTGIVTTIKAEKPETAIGQVSGVISSGGANVISSGGGNVISSGGGNVISAGGGNVISAGGGNVISAGGGNFANRASVRHKSKPKQVLLATGGYKFKSPGTAKLVVKLTKAGKSLIKKLRAAAAKARKHHKRVKPVKLAYTLIVGNINGVPGTPAAKATRYIKIKL